MLFQDKKRFWLIFDTCTVPEYYQDIHNVLAMPPGATVMYQYRKRWLSLEAVKAASNPQQAPSAVLLVYAQWRDYARGEGEPPSSTPSDEILWVPIRLAEMQLVPPQEGENFFFHFRVLEYPKPDETALLQVLRPLIQADEVPFHKWVSISDDLQGLSPLRRGTRADNWQSIAARLGVPPMQFAGDSFWRLREPHIVEQVRLLRPTYKISREPAVGATEARAVESIYELTEGDVCSMSLASYSPAFDAGGPSQEDRTPREVNIECTKEGPVSLDCDARIELRRYTEEVIRLKADRSARLGPRTASLHLRTSPGRDEWPTGPMLTLRFTVRKPKWHVAFAIFAAVAAPILLLLAAAIKDTNLIWAILCTAFATLLALGAGLVLTGTLRAPV